MPSNNVVITADQIVTMDATCPCTDAVLVVDDRIVCVGMRTEVEVGHRVSLHADSPMYHPPGRSRPVVQSTADFAHLTDFFAQKKCNGVVIVCSQAHDLVAAR